MEEERNNRFEVCKRLRPYSLLRRNELYFRIFFFLPRRPKLKAKKFIYLFIAWHDARIQSLCFGTTCVRDNCRAKWAYRNAHIYDAHRHRLSARFFALPFLHPIFMVGRLFHCVCIRRNRYYKQKYGRSFVWCTKLHISDASTLVECVQCQWQTYAIATKSIRWMEWF